MQPSSNGTCHSQIPELEFLDLLYISLKGFFLDSALALLFPLTSK